MRIWNVKHVRPAETSTSNSRGPHSTWTELKAGGAVYPTGLGLTQILRTLQQSLSITVVSRRCLSISFWHRPQRIWVAGVGACMGDCTCPEFDGCERTGSFAETSCKCGVTSAQEACRATWDGPCECACPPGLWPTDVTESARAHSYYSSKEVQEQGLFRVGCSSLAVTKCLIDAIYIHVDSKSVLLTP